MIDSSGKRIHFGKNSTKPMAERYRWTSDEKRQALAELRADPTLAPPAPLPIIKLSDVAVKPSGFGTMGLYSTGFKTLDDLTLGFDPGDYIVMGARTNQGKTQLALYIAIAQAAAGVPTVFISRELSNPEIQGRIEFITKQKLDNLHAFDTHRLEADKLDSAIRQFASSHSSGGMGFVVIDHLHAFCRGGNLTEALGELSGTLRETAQDLQIPILTLSQLNRQDYKNEEGPLNWHLKESGYIEEDATTILMGWRTVEGLNLKLTKSRRRDLAELPNQTITLKANQGKLSD